MRTISSGLQKKNSMKVRRVSLFIKKFWKSLGPGFITGSSDDDPSGIGTYAASGAQFGFTQLWTVWVTLPLMIFVQEMSARVGMVTGRGLVAAMKDRISRPVLAAIVLLLLAANTFNIGADIGAMADSIRLIIPQVPFVAAALAITFITIFLEIFVTYKTYVKFLKWLTVTLLMYLVVAATITIDWRTALREFIFPSMALSRDALLMVIAIFGTTISPYLIFWQASQEVEEEILRGRTSVKMRSGVVPSDLRAMRYDVTFGMVFSNVIMFFIILTTSAVLFGGTGVSIATAADAARVLEPVAGRFAGTFFALGVVGSGLLAIPILAGAASYAIAELFNWREGLHHTWKQARGFYAIIVLSTAVGLSINFIGIPPMRALVWAAIINGFVAPFTLYLLLRAGSDKTLMGDKVNTPLQKYGVTLTLIIMVSCIALYVVLS